MYLSLTFENLLNPKCVPNPAGIIHYHKTVANNPVCDIGRAVVYHNPRTLALPQVSVDGSGSNPRSLYQPCLLKPIIMLRNAHFWGNGD